MLTVEDGTGLAGADSYGAVSGARAYWADHGLPAATETLTDAQVEVCLRLATDYVDTFAQWRGTRLSASQRRAFPRAGLVDYDGTAVSGVPWQVVSATYHVASAARTETLWQALARGGRVASESVGPISVSYAPDAPAGLVVEAVDRLLAGFKRGSRDMAVATYNAPASKIPWP